MAKEVYIVAGANGSGKTTFSKELIEKESLYFLNADEFAKEINPHDLEKAKVQAGKMFFKKFYSFLNEERSFILETTLSGNYLTRLISKLNKNDYSVNLVYIFLENPAVCVNRIKERVLKGGHFVPEEDIVRRYYRSKLNFWNSYKNLTDNWYLFYNSSENFQEVAVGEKDEFIISDERLFQHFLSDLEGN